MSHSSNLMTIEAMMQCLADLKRVITSGDITVSDYLSIFEVFADIEELKESISNLRLIVEVERAQQGDICDVKVEKISPTLGLLFDTDAKPVYKASPSDGQVELWDSSSVFYDDLKRRIKNTPLARELAKTGQGL